MRLKLYINSLQLSEAHCFIALVLGQVKTKRASNCKGPVCKHLIMTDMHFFGVVIFHYEFGTESPSFSQENSAREKLSLSLVEPSNFGCRA